MLLLEKFDSSKATGTDTYKGCQKLYQEVHQLAQALTAEEQQLKADDFHEVRSGGRFPYYTKLRPGVRQFLAEAAKLYELNIFTKGQEGYAAEIQKILDPQKRLFQVTYIYKDLCR